MKIVIVEDEYVICNGLVKLIQSFSDKYKIVGQAFNGIEGLKILREKEADLVITDIRMPDMDGINMISVLRKENIKVKAIILSAYSEFEYAKTAINLGVSEYILKPVSVNEIRKSLKKIEDTIEKEKRLINLNSNELFELQNIFSYSISGNISDFDALSLFVKNEYNIDVNGKFYILIIYAGMYYNECADKIEDIFKFINNNFFKHKKVNLSQDNIFAVIFYNVNNYEKFKKYISISLIKMINTNIGDNFSYGIIQSNGIMNIHDDYLKIKNSLDWSLVFEKNLIEYESIPNINYGKLVMNIDIEDNIKQCIIKNDYDNLKKYFIEFKKYCISDVYHPSDIKALCIKAFWTIVNTERQINANAYEKIDVKSFLQKIIKSVTWNEIICTFELLIKDIVSHIEKENKDDKSLLIKRALNLIHEYYNQGLNLEEIANKLNVTSEYLGTQFKKEIGQPFNLYIRNYRNEKIKTLLLGTNLKIYEIAKLVGYSDAKYMSKVFKESTGYLPNDYRKINK